MRKTLTALIVLMATLVAVTFLASGVATAQRVARAGDTVEVNYTLTLDDGSVIYTTIGQEPAQYELGKGALIPGFEEAVIGMQVGESKTVTIPPEKAYGPVRPELVQEVSWDLLPEGFEPEVGKHLQSTLNGTPVAVVITEVTPNTVTIDANHVMAGKNLTFSIELLEIIENTSGLASLPVLFWVITGALAAIATAFGLYYLKRRHRRRLAR